MKFLLALATLLICSGNLCADTIYLKDGRVLEGELERDGNKVKIRTALGAITIRESEIERIEEKVSPEEEIAEQRKLLEETDVDGRIELAEYAREHRLFKIEKELLWDVIAIDPDHETAREKLGHLKHDGEWMTKEQAMKAQGMVRYKGRWVTEEEMAAAEALEEQETLHKKTIFEIRQQMHRLSSKQDKTVNDAREKLAKFDRDDRIEVFMDALTWDKREARAYAAEQLGVLQHREAGNPLAKRVIEDTSSTVRETALKAILALKADGVPGVFIKALLGENQARRVRAADALYYFPDSRIVPYVLTALGRILKDEPDASMVTYGFTGDVTQTNLARKVMVNNGGTPIQLPTTSKFEGSFGDPGKKDEEKARKFEKEALLRTLERITGENFGDDWESWVRWYNSKVAEKKSGE
jgi:hypothetical protein